MPKLVLDVIPSQYPNDNDLMVFDKQKQVWVQTPKSVFLHATQVQIEDLKHNLELANKKIEELTQDVGFMANTLKSMVKKESVK